jgi:hypothetical protein
MTQKKIKNLLNTFIIDGFIKFNSLLNKRDCNKLYNEIKINRNWGPELFQSEKDYKKEFRNKLKKKLNPGKGIQNLVDDHNLKFIEQNKSVIQLLKLILGQNYEIILSKFVVAVPKSWMPNYVKNLNKKRLISNFNEFIKEKYRDVTYFRGIDYHMDSIDWEGNSNKFVTMYIYLNDTDAAMSPLNVIKGSHVFGHTSFPHYIKTAKNNSSLEYSPDNKNFKKFKFHKLVGKAGTVYLWSSNTLHGTSPSLNDNDKFRISLRYLIKKTSKSKSILDKLIKDDIVSKTREDRNNYKRILK